MRLTPLAVVLLLFVILLMSSCIKQWRIEHRRKILNEDELLLARLDDLKNDINDSIIFIDDRLKEVNIAEKSELKLRQQNLGIQVCRVDEMINSIRKRTGLNKEFILVKFEGIKNKRSIKRIVEHLIDESKTYASNSQKQKVQVKKNPESKGEVKKDKKDKKDKEEPQKKELEKKEEQ